MEAFTIEDLRRFDGIELGEQKSPEQEVRHDVDLIG
jgi:hypothetical protein